MKFILMAITMITSLLITSCADDDFVGKRPDQDASTITVSEAVETSSLGRDVRVRGTVSSVCQEEGCWMSISDGNAFLRMTFKDESFYVPMDLKGDVVVEGVVREEVYSADDARAIGSSLGWTASQIEALEGDQRIPIMVATGVLFLKDD